MIKVALLTTDSREHFKDYGNPQPYFGTAPEALLEGFKLMPKDIEVHIVSCLQKEPVSSPAKLADNIYYHALHVPNIGWMKTAYQGCIRSVRRKLREIEPTIVHGQGTERDCAISAVFSGLPNVLTIHGNMRLVAKFLQAKPLTYYWFASKLERLCLRKTDGVVAISSYTQSSIAAYARRIWLVPNAVHPSFFQVCRRPDETPRILCVANIGARKNQIGLIHSLEILAKRTPLKLIFAGGGSDPDPYFQEFRNMVRKREWCEYRGPLDRAGLQNEMALASVGILPSFEDNCPMVVLEAAASGLPFAASRVGGVPDLIEDNVTGLLFDPSSPDGIRAAIARMLQDKHLAESVAQTALTACRHRFAPESVAREHLRIYKAVLDESAQMNFVSAN
jgi:glycosyltransferase involved in cell wall biosynthesis